MVHLTTRTDHGPGPAVGFVVSKAVGNAVVRNRVKRRLRAAVGERLGVIPESSELVIRALPPAANSEYCSLTRDLDGALQTATRRLAERNTTR